MREEILKLAKEMMKKDPSLTEWISTKFPELREIEDERIKKEIIRIVDIWTNSSPVVNGIPREILLDWVEKQGKKKLDDKVEPKFHEGEWVFIEEVKGYKNGPFQIKTVDSFGYSFDEYHTIPFMYEELLSKWTIQDAKDGDVLCCENGWTCIFKALDNHTNTFSSYCFMDNDKWFCNTGSKCHTLDKAFIKAYNGEIHPATKEQRDTLMKAMADAGYTFNFEKKELRQIEQKPTENKGMNLVEEEMTPFQKKVFCIIDTTIEEEQGLKQVCDELFVLASNEIEQNYAWSEEDEEMLRRCISATFDHGYLKECDWLKSLRPQNTWKPSEEMLEALYRVISENVMAISEDEMLLDKLYQGLKYGRVLSKN